MKRIRIVITLIVAMLGLTLVTSCTNNTSSTTSGTNNTSSTTSAISKSVETKYTLNFNTDGGSAISSIELNKGDAVEAPTAPTKENLTFMGWFSDIDLLEAYTFPGVMPEGNLTLYAKYGVKVSFDTNGGAAIDPIVEEAKAIVKYPTPTNGENIFMGWYLDKELTQKASILIPEKNTTLYASWQVLEEGTALSIAEGLKPSGLEGTKVTYNVEKVADGIKVTSTADKEAWSALVAPITVNAKENTTVVVTYEGTKGVPVLFKLEGTGSESITAVETEHGKNMTGEEQKLIWTVKPENLTETGQENFVIFLNEGNEGLSDGTNPDYILIKSIKLFRTITMDDTPQEAIYFDTMGGSAVAPIKNVLGSEVSAPANPTKAGYDFAGWYADKELTNTFDFAKMPKGPTIVYAKWTANADVVLTINTNGGTILDKDGNPINSLTVQAGSNIVIPTPTKEGYLFNGYYLDQKLTTPFTDMSITENTTIYISWINPSVELNPATAINVLDYTFNNGNEGIYTIDSTNNTLVVSSASKGEWDYIYANLDSTLDTKEYIALHVVVSGQVGQVALFKINDADEYRVELTSNTQEMYFMLKNPVDVAKKQLIFIGAGSAWTTETSMTISTFEFMKHEMNTSLVSYDLKNAFTSNQDGHYSFVVENGNLLVSANTVKTAWSFAKATLPETESGKMVVFHAVFTGAEGTQILFKLNDSKEFSVTIGESGSAEVYWVLPETVNFEKPFIFFVDGPVDYVGEGRTEATVLTFSVLEMLMVE